MTTATHLLVGGAVGSLVGQPGLALGLGVLSHVPLDMVPHFDFDDYRRDVALGVSVGVVVIAGMVLRGSAGSGWFWGMLGGVIPDLENLAFKLGLMKEERRIFPTHRKGGLRKGGIPHGASRGRRDLFVQGALGLVSLLVIWRQLIWP